MRTTNKKSTHDRIIEAAGRLFAEKGFKGTTVKDITESAGANVAAVNYYFRDKEKLYEEVILYVFNYMKQNFPLDKGLDEAFSPEARLRLFVHNLLNRFVSMERPAWQGILWAQERMNPKPITTVIMHDEILRTRKLLASIIRELLGPGAGAEDIELCEQSIIGQILHNAHMRSPHAPPAVRKQPATKDEIDSLASFIADFSLGGMKYAFGDRKERKPARRGVPSK